MPCGRSAKLARVLLEPAVSTDTAAWNLFSQVCCVFQESSLRIEEREVLADKLATTDAVMNEQFQRFSAVLLLLSTTLSIPDDLLVAVSDVGADGVDEGMDQVSPSFRDATTCQSDVLMYLKH